MPAHQLSSKHPEKPGTTVPSDLFYSPYGNSGSILSLLLAGKASASLYSVLQCRIHAGSTQALTEPRNGDSVLNLTTDKNIWNSPDFSLQEAKAMFREAIISFFPESCVSFLQLH